MFSSCLSVSFFGLISTGCTTYKTIEKAEKDSPIFFSGTRLNFDAINKKEIALKKFSTSPPKSPVIDLPFSFLADLIISSLTGGMAAYEVITDGKRKKSALE